MKLETQTLTVSIRRDADDVYRFIATPENMPKWAKGLGDSFRRAGSAWIADTPLGTVKVRFEPANGFRVADHYVQPPSGPEIHIPIRVFGREGGSEVAFTLFPQPGMTVENFQDDYRRVREDLDALKHVLEQQGRPAGGTGKADSHEKAG